MLVSEGGYEGADSDLQYVDVAQDLDQRLTLPAKASPVSLTLIFKIMQLPLLWLCIYVSGVEWNLDAWSLGTYVLLLVC
jgi:hypothetical protein